MVDGERRQGVSGNGGDSCRIDGGKRSLATVEAPRHRALRYAPGPGCRTALRRRCGRDHDFARQAADLVGPSADGADIRFRHEHIPLLLYVPPAYLGLLSTNYFLSRFISPVDRTYLEHANVYAQLLFSAWYMLLIQAYRIRSAYAFAIVTSFQLISASWNEIRRMRDRSAGRVGFPSVYVVPLAAFMVLGVEAVTASLDIFTPLTGRMGNEAPAEIIIAVISAAVGLVFFPPLVPLFHRVSRRAQRRIILLLAMITIGMMVFFAGPWWTTYDFMHPKRSGVQYMYNVRFPI